MRRHKTRPGRLATLDRLVLQRESVLLKRSEGAWRGAPVVDVGIGAMPWTTLELASTLTETLGDAAPPVVGVDVDANAVARAESMVQPGVRFVVGHFTVPGIRARFVRALNVLRDHPCDEVPAAHQALCSMLVEGGLLLEGSCGPRGEVGAVHRIRRTGDRAIREGLWLWTDGSRGGAPLLFRDRLPRDLRRSVRPGHPLGELMDAWMTAFTDVGGPDPLDRLAASVHALGRPDLTMVGRGAVAWTPEGGVPPP